MMENGDKVTSCQVRHFLRFVVVALFTMVIC
jgi:hypothetical protein